MHCGAPHPRAPSLTSFLSSSCRRVYRHFAAAENLISSFYFFHFHVFSRLGAPARCQLGGSREMSKSTPTMVIFLPLVLALLLAVPLVLALLRARLVLTPATHARRDGTCKDAVSRATVCVNSSPSGACCSSTKSPLFTTNVERSSYVHAVLSLPSVTVRSRCCDV